MTRGQRPRGDLPGLHVRMHTRPPVADYQCARCPHTDAGTGPDGINALYGRITQHHDTCPGRGVQHEAPAQAGARKGKR